MGIIGIVGQNGRPPRRGGNPSRRFVIYRGEGGFRGGSIGKMHAQTDTTFELTYRFMYTGEQGRRFNKRKGKKLKT
jgi:hypothetical protein